MAAIGKKVGIDLGTTNSVVAIMQGPDPEILYSREGQPQIRSAVSLRERKGRGGEVRRQVLVGDPAIGNWEYAPEDTIVSIKRLMGLGVEHPEVQRVKDWFYYKVVEPSEGTKDSVRVVMGGQEYSPVDISAMILRKLKEDAEYSLGEEVTHAVITVPAYFSQAQKAATRMAGLKAGLKVIKILDEPTAAAMSYGLDETEDAEPKNVLVYDLGGGTFDISVLLMCGPMFVTLNKEGDMWLGGDNFDQAVVEYAVEVIREEYGTDPSSDKKFMVALRRAAQKARESLSAAKWADLELAGRLKDKEGFVIDVFVEITREKYEELIRPLVERSLRLVDRAMENAKLTVDDVDYVLMTGNATITPLVQQMMEDKFGPDRVLRKKHPKLCVAEGAAIVAKLLVSTVCHDCGHPNDEDAEECAECGTPLQLRDKVICRHCEFPNESGAQVCAMCSNPLQEFVLGGISSRHYGVELARDAFSVFIEKNDEIPTEDARWKTFYTQVPDQRVICIPVWGGDDLEKASANQKQGEVFAILPSGLATGSGVRVSLSLDSDEIFRLAARLEDGTDLQPWVIKGEADQKAIEALDGIERDLGELGGALSQSERQAIEEQREQVLRHLQEGNYKDAQEGVEQLGQLVTALKRPEAGPGSLEEKAQGLIGYTEFVLREFSWAIGAEQAYELTSLVAKTRQALEAGDAQALQQAFTALDQATDRLPDAIRVLVGIRGAIMARIQPVEPERAAELQKMLAETEEAFQKNPILGRLGLVRLAASVAEALKEIESKALRGVACPACGHDLPPGARFCPECKADTWMLGEQRVRTSGKIST